MKALVWLLSFPARLALAGACAASLLTSSLAIAQNVALPSQDGTGTHFNWISAGSGTEGDQGEIQVYFSRYIDVSPTDMMVMIAVVFSSPRTSATSEAYWGEYVLDRIDCDTYSDLSVRDFFFFDQRGNVLQNKVDHTNGQVTYPTGHAPPSEPGQWQRIPARSPVDSVASQLCRR
jgi:hypothetical protein